jgi:hypothetical protein
MTNPNYPTEDQLSQLQAAAEALHALAIECSLISDQSCPAWRSGFYHLSDCIDYRRRTMYCDYGEPEALQDPPCMYGPQPWCWEQWATMEAMKDDEVSPKTDPKRTTTVHRVKADRSRTKETT